MKAAVVGYGYWGTHIVRNFVALLGPQNVVICDHDRCRLALARQTYPQVELVPGFSDLCDRPDIAAVAVVTPVESHFALASRALAAGKHVLLEKPMTKSSREATQLVELAEANGLVLMVDHTFLFTGPVRELRSLLCRGELGSLIAIQSERTNLGLYRLDVDVVYDLAVHDIAIFDYLLDGSPEWVQADGLSHPYDDHASDASLTLSYGATIARCHVSWLAPVKTRRVTLIGSKRSVVWDDVDDATSITIHECGLDAAPEGQSTDRVTHRRGTSRIVRVCAREALEAEVEHFVSCVLTGARPNVCDARSALRSVSVLESARRALASGSREPVWQPCEPRRMVGA